MTDTLHLAERTRSEMRRMMLETQLVLTYIRRFEEELNLSLNQNRDPYTDTVTAVVEEPKIIRRQHNKSSNSMCIADLKHLINKTEKSRAASSESRTSTYSGGGSGLSRPRVSALANSHKGLNKILGS